ECVEYAAEDATSVPLDKLIEVLKVAEDAGADVVRISDTKGQVEFNSFRKLIEHLTKNLRARIDVHCHNDRGLAVANAISALEGGATGVHVSVLGLGERCGIVDLATFVEDLETLYHVDTGVNFKEIPSLYRYVSAVAGIPIPPNFPIMGAFARVHKAGIHQKSVIHCPETYETVDWNRYGLEREYEFGAMQSKELVEVFLKNLNVFSEVKKRIVDKIRDMSMTKGRSLRRPEVWRLIEEEAGVLPSFASASKGEEMDALIFIKVKPSCDELDLIKSVRNSFSEHSVPIVIRDISGDWDFIIDVKDVKNPKMLDEITGEIRKNNKDILETSTSIIFDEYK
ncbi:MAG: hypothetical protein ABIH76_09015, partial [Candidatus Bathyarchaeota archaeon]